MALADVYDALTTRRVYTDAIPRHAAVAIVIEGVGRHFAPHIDRVICDIADELKAVAGHYSD